MEDRDIEKKTADRIGVLKKVYDYYDRLTAEAPVACRKYCSLCCTANVTMTSLEGRLIASHLPAEAFADLKRRVLDAGTGMRFQPQTTTNHLATLCMEGQSLPEECMPPAPDPCPLIEAAACSIYAVRPFGCRSMFSVKDCHGIGFAQMDDLILSINTVFLQFIEHLDLRGVTGNLTDVLSSHFVLDTAAAWDTGDDGRVPEGMVTNRPVTRLMIPPQHRERIYHVVQELNRIGLGYS